jgi:hypothetical protein
MLLYWRKSHAPISVSVVSVTDRARRRKGLAAGDQMKRPVLSGASPGSGRGFFSASDEFAGNGKTDCELIGGSGAGRQSSSRESALWSARGSAAGGYVSGYVYVYVRFLHTHRQTSTRAINCRDVYFV